MAEKKADLLIKAQNLGLKVTNKNTVVEIKKALATAADKPVDTDETTDSKPTETKVTKAGKRSAKAIKEAEELAEKEARKERVEAGLEDPSEAGEKRGPVPVVRPRAERRGKGYRKSAELIDGDKTYDLEEAVKLAKETSPVKFDAAVELHIRLGVDPRQSDQNIRESLVLPHGTGKAKIVAVFAASEDHEAAKKAGADIVGEADLLEQLQREEINFDVLISAPQMMSQLGRYAKLLGPKGLMPNPKSGTVTKDIPNAVKEAKAGRIEFRVDQHGIVHTIVGRVSFTAEQLLDNANAIMQAINSAKPSSLKGNYLLSCFMTTSMGPSIKIQV